MFITILFVAVSSVLLVLPSEAHAETRVTQHTVSSAQTGGIVVIHQTASASGGTSSAHITTVVNGKKVVDIHETTAGTPITLEARYVATNKEAVATTNVRHETPPTPVSHTVLKSPAPIITPPAPDASTPLPPLPPANPVVAEHLTNIIPEHTETNDLPPAHTRATPWTHLITSFTRTITYVTSFFFP